MIYLYPDLHARLRKGQEVAEARATPLTSEQYESVSAQDQVQVKVGDFPNLEVGCITIHRFI